MSENFSQDLKKGDLCADLKGYDWKAKKGEEDYNTAHVISFFQQGEQHLSIQVLHDV